MAAIGQQYKEKLTEEDDYLSSGKDLKMTKVVEINHQWKKDYTKLQEEYNLLKVRLLSIEERNGELERQNQMLTRQLGVVNCDTGSQRSFQSEVKCEYSKEDVQLLQQQLLIFKEDFIQEKNEHHRAANESKKLKNELQNAHRLLEKLTVKNNIIKDNFRKVSYEKDHIMQQLRKLTATQSTLTSSTTSDPSRLHHNNTSVYDTFTLKQQKYVSVESLKNEDLIAHSPSFFETNTYFCGGGKVQSDGPTRPRST